jgi:hypothetical protein
MLRKVSLLTFVALLSLVVAVPAFAAPGAPNFGEAIYADGEAYGTKGTTDLPAPNGKNNQSFDLIFAFTNAAAEQLPVAEAAPGNPMYNGGRWWAVQATWLVEPMGILKSYDEVMAHVDAGHIELAYTTNYFQCPLLPVK